MEVWVWEYVLTSREEWTGSLRASQDLIILNITLDIHHLFLVVSCAPSLLVAS